jgi:uncharacterized protein (TIGR00269 family)
METCMHACKEMAVCTFCKGRGAIYSRLYSGEALCEGCFCGSIEAKVRSSISKYEMLQPEDKIMVALSGGKDSATLLHILAKIEKAFPRAALVAGTVDEGIAGYRDEALNLAANNCARLGVPHAIISFKETYGYSLDELVGIIREKEGKGLTPCSFCGVLRRQALNTLARRVGADKLATAHTLDDEIQTMMLNIIHGDALRLTRVKPVLPRVHPRLVQRIKPFCEIPEREVVLYAYLKNIDYQGLSCPHAGAALRNDVRAMLNRLEEKHPGTKFTIFRSMERIRPALEDTVGAAKLEECSNCGEPTGRETCQPCQMLQDLCSS